MAEKRILQLSFMEDNVISQVITGVFTLAGSLLMGLLTFSFGELKKKNEKLRQRLLRSYRDNLAFYRLEKYYTQELAKGVKTPEAWKRSVRAKMRATGLPTPSEDATERRLKQRLEDNTA